MKRGRFITLEGGDGAGKSTQAKRLAEALRKRGKKVLLTREVGGSDGAEAIREVWLSGEYRWDAITELLLISAARRDHIEKVIRPALKKGTWVISDRFADSTYVYQGYGMGLDKKYIRQIYKIIAGELVPDLTVVLDVPVEIGAKRMAGRLLDRFERKDKAFHKRLRQGYLARAKSEPKRFVVVDAGNSLDVTGRNLVATVLRKLKLQ
ncbi:MAG: dTMP kinase [Alphaproteobacteria bacterium]|nr:dTMP kinase [Alphaproteobacteria bacterium]